MKVLLLFCLFFPLLCSAQSQQVPAAETPPPYKTQPGLPPLRLLLGDSTTWFQTEKVARKKPMLLLFFSPACSHCQKSAEELVRLKDSLPDMQLVMATLAPIGEMNAFREKYGTDALPQTIVGKDAYVLLPPFFNIRHLPFIALYDRKGNLSETLEGSLPIPLLLDKVRVLRTQ